MPLFVVYLLAAATGYVSLSQEILWIKVVGSADHGRPETFAHALGFYLLGLAAGALFGRRIQARLRLSPLRYVAVMLAAGGLIFFFGMPAGAWLHTRNDDAGLLALLVATGLTSFAMGTVFPLLCAEGARDAAATGSGVSRVIVANVLGATAGPLLTGFVLLQVETLQHNILFLSIGCLVMAEVLWLAAPEARGRRRGVVAGALAALTLLVAQPTLYTLFLESLHFGTDGYTPGYKYVVQGRSAIVGVWPSLREYGDGLYDGGFFLDPVTNENMITRAYFLSALHPRPRRVLEIGLGTGSWARVMADNPDVDSLTIVELAPEYVKMMFHFPSVASVLDDPKVRLYFDDGRRWMTRHPARRFDAIVINGTWHWRSGATHILSAEFLREARSHLAPGGVLYFNTTGSLDVIYTAAGVFPHVTRYLNFVAASDSSFSVDRATREKAFARYRAPDGTTPLAKDGKYADALPELLDTPTDEVGPDFRRANDLWFVTDDNMATEFKANGAGKWWRDLPGRVWRPERAWPNVLF
ncbi:MAG: methyltransferase domain-containing protein [Gemmatimonadetes bacterium]|nr:methyltransferase domain-containing protein [Gemmatimonadota bacterium]MBI3504624.1 methyltransferase domain-containing protein [Pseudomonadota bacterium]